MEWIGDYAGACWVTWSAFSAS